MFWYSKEKRNRIAKELADRIAVDLIRERLADHVSDGSRTQFTIPPDELKDGTVNFTVTNVARVNYEVEEWADVTSANTDVRTAFDDNPTQPVTGNTNPDYPDYPDYWKTR